MYYQSTEGLGGYWHEPGVILPVGSKVVETQVPEQLKRIAKRPLGIAEQCTALSSMQQENVCNVVFKIMQ